MTSIKVGIIGYGSMGSMMHNAFLRSKAVEKENLYVSTRTKITSDKNISICASNSELAGKCGIIFLCVKPLEIKDVLSEIKNQLDGNKHIISIAGSVTLDNMQKIFSGMISRALPTLLSEIKEGITLLCHNPSVKQENIKILETLLKTLGEVKTVPENQFEILSDLTSCAPGLIASIFNEYAEAVIPHTALDKNEIKRIMVQTLYGTAKLFHDLNFDFDGTIKRVATKGGATEAGIAVLQSRLKGVFAEMIEKTLECQFKRKQKIDEQFIRKQNEH